MSVRAIQKARGRVPRDEFPNGAVVRWQSSQKYTYAALKTPAGWFTTARVGNAYVPQTVTWEQLLEILARSESSDVEIAGDWTPVPDAK